ncbi:MAG: acetylglutamate kinase [Oscillospiraceae bacterium]|nr:acetylglutamate kinase [Oscillospiraceae bacterium]
MSTLDRAKILSEALPYIQKYSNKTIVIKYGGNAMINQELFAAVMDDIVLMSFVGIRVVLVHGGGPEINDMLNKIGKESKFINGLRYTDEETMDIVQMVLCGKVNKNLVSAINRTGGKAVGLCGADGSLFQAERMNEDGVDYGYVGNIVNVNPDIVSYALDGGYIPVVSSVAQGVDADVTYNINADTAASKLAIALGAEKLILLTDIAGLMLDPKDESTLLPLVHITEIPKLIKNGVVKGGMIPKVDCCVEAVRQGVDRTTILDGRVPHSILIESFTDEGIGTMIK